MSAGEKQGVAQWVDAIDIRKDGIPDSTAPELLLKKMLKEDLQTLWSRKTEWRITEDEYNRYANAAKAILERGDVGLREIRAAYEAEKTAIITKTNTNLENLSMKVSGGMRKIRNVATDIHTSIEQKYISGDTVQAFSNEEGNYLISIQDFEQQLKTNPIETINALAMKNYLIHLKSRGLLNKTTLEQKCGWPDRFLALSVVWSTKMKKAEQLRDAFFKHGFMSKLNTNMHSAMTWGVEDTTEGIFKNVIISRASQEWGKESMLDEKWQTMGYKKIIKDLIGSFPEGKITGAMVGELLRKKLQEGLEKTTQLKAEKDKHMKTATVGSTLRENSIDSNEAMKPLLGKNIHALTKDENKEFFKLLQGTNPVYLSEELQKLMEIEAKLQKQEQQNDVIKTLHESKPAREILAVTHDNKKSTDDIVSSLAPTMARDRIKKNLSDQDALYRETLTAIGFTSSSEITRDTKKLAQAISLLEQKWLEESRLYGDLVKFRKLDSSLQAQEAREYIKATENISEEALQIQERNGRTIAASAEELYARDVKQQKTTDFTVPASHTEQYAQKEENLSLRLPVLPDNEKTPLRKIGDDTCFVTKDGDRYILSIHGQTEVCANPDEVKNTLGMYEFFHDMGLEPLISSMGPFLSAVKRMNPICPEFSIQKGILPGEQEKTLLHAVGTVLNLDMGDIMALGVGAIKDAFRKQVRAIGRTKTHSLLKHRWILDEQGEFSLENMNRALSLGKRVLQAT